jgi:hypothetical protein
MKLYPVILALVAICASTPIFAGQGRRAAEPACYPCQSRPSPNGQESRFRPPKEHRHRGHSMRTGMPPSGRMDGMKEGAA